MATYTDQFFVIDTFTPPPAGTALSFLKLDLVDQNDDGDFDQLDNDTIDGSIISKSFSGDTLTIDVPGVGNITYTGHTFNLADGRAVFTPNDGQVLQNGTYVSSVFVDPQNPLLASDLGPACFVADTLISTPRGDVQIQDLITGDKVLTLDHGAQTIRWIGYTKVDGSGKFAPIVFAPGAIGNSRTLMVSPEHRILIKDWKAELYFNEPEFLVPAKALINGSDITQQRIKSVFYYHLLFDRHEIIQSEGAYSESFFPGGQIMLEDSGIRAELLELFPELETGVETYSVARPTLGAFESALLFDNTYALKEASQTGVSSNLDAARAAG